jgi:hypothetical protein
MPKINIEVPVAEIWLTEDDFDGYDTVEIDYEYDYSVLKRILAEFFADDYSISIEIAAKIATDFDLYDSLLDYYDNGSLLERLRDELYDEACKYYRENYK